jgi:hypothetical protein
MNFILRPSWHLYNRVKNFLFPDRQRPNFWLMDKVENLIVNRVVEKINRRDYLQLLLEAQSTDFSQKENVNLSEIDSSIEKKLSPNVIFNNMIRLYRLNIRNL